jgi:ABC-2 type transport system ATP-binding protein
VLGAGFVVDVEAAAAPGPGKELTARLAAIPGVMMVEQPAETVYRLTADHDVRAEAARAVVAADGALTRLSIDEPSLDAIYTRFFEKQAAGAKEMRDAA